MKTLPLFLILFSSLSFSKTLDLGFRVGNSVLKTNLNKKKNAIHYSVLDLGTGVEVDIIKRKKSCYLPVNEIRSSIKSIPTDLSHLDEVEIDKLIRDLEMLIMGSGYSQFDDISSFLRVFEDYLKQYQHQNCILFENIKKLI